MRSGAARPAARADAAQRARRLLAHPAAVAPQAIDERGHGRRAFDAAQGDRGIGAHALVRVVRGADEVGTEARRGRPELAEIERGRARLRRVGVMEPRGDLPHDARHR